MNLERLLGLNRKPSSAAQTQFAAPVAGAEEAGEGGDEGAAALGVGVPGELALAAEAGDHQRLAAAVLLDPRFAVAKADAGLLPAAHRHLGGEIVDEDVVDVDRAALDPSRHLLGSLPLAEDGAGE